ncbi:Predicted arabinose efflux permease, MFS family [Micromonospora purpureochromogenes]|uniref:Predicted arabinose efflux permease, MFS family n=1 Tax=Micromonospora purpureochromogenes TaxID=47872 RepID=A0A1C4U1F6_9ACTN|nr:MFS transporter [Micromonospora purpureochromogenes]SCE65506.1 Predicted arabinose efflux permease, MFS family [Micromonospora purpureochromogenes]
MTAASTRPTAVLRDNRRFRTFWVGETISQFGDRISELALPLIAVTVLAATPAQVSILTALIWLPNLLGMFVGAWVDQRTRKRRLLIVADLVRAAVLLSLPVAYLLDVVTLTQLYLVALLTGAGAVLFNMARQAFFVALVPPSAYVEANSKLSLSRAASFVAGPALGGGLVQALTAPVAVLVDVVSFLGSALLIGRIPVAEARPAPPRSSTLGLVRDGLVLVLRHPVMRAALGCTSTVNFFTLMTNALLVLYASRELGLSAGAIGLAFGGGAVGGLAGAALAPRVSRTIGLGRTAMIGVVLFPAPLALTAFVSGPTWARIAALAAIEMVSSVGVMLMDVNLNALLTSVTPDDARGRRAGAYSAVNYGIRPVGALVGGWLGTTIGLRPTLVVAGLGGVLAVLWLLASPVRHIATIDEPTGTSPVEGRRSGSPPNPRNRPDPPPASAGPPHRDDGASSEAGSRAAAPNGP